MTEARSLDDEVGISAKSLDSAQRSRVQAALEELAQIYRPQRELARRLGVTQQTVSRALAEAGPIGVKLAARVAHLRRQSLEELLAGQPALGRFADLEGWADAARSAVEERWATTAGAHAVGDWPLFLGIRRADARLVADLCALWTRWATREERAALDAPHPPSGRRPK